jgi:hypothetical protein
MVLPLEERLKFFVFIIESPSPVDLYHGRSEANLLRQAIGLNNIRCASRTAINLEAFVAAVRVGLKEEMEANPGLLPILHISAHGSTDGIQLSSDEVLDWEALRELLRPVNKALNGMLFVCMSTCQGYSGSQMAMDLDDPDYPFYAIVGNAGEPTWPEAAVAFATFYHLIANGHYITEAVSAMHVASGNDRFFLTTAEEAKQGFLDLLEQKTIDTQGAVNELKETEKTEPPDELAKRLRISKEN